MISLQFTPELLSQVEMKCNACGWEGSIFECSPDAIRGKFVCPYCLEAEVDRKAKVFCLSFHRMSDHYVRVMLDGQFLMQFTGDEKSPEYYLAQDLRIVADTLEQLSIMGKDAATAAEIFREKIRKEYALS